MHTASEYQHLPRKAVSHQHTAGVSWHWEFDNLASIKSHSSIASAAKPLPKHLVERAMCATHSSKKMGGVALA